MRPKLNVLVKLLIPAHPRIRIFTNHIEYYNPGGFPKPIEELKGKDLSIPRNPILAKLFRMVKLAENAGYGLDNIENNWKEYNGSTVDYIIDFDSTIVKFKTKLEGVNEGIIRKIEGVNEGVKNELLSILNILQKKPFQKTKEIAEQLDKGVSTVERYVKILKENNLIVFEGAPKTGGYKLKQ